MDEVFRNNTEALLGMLPELTRLLSAAHRVSQVNPMPLKLLTEIFTEVEEKLQTEKLKQIEVCRKISDLLTPLLGYGIGHIEGHSMVNQVLRLRGLLYRLLSVLIAGIAIVALANTATSLKIPDELNFPLILILIVWLFYVLISKLWK